MQHGLFHYGGKAAVTLVAKADVAGVYAIFGQGGGALRHVLEQAVAVVVEVANQWNRAVGRGEPVPYVRHGLGRGLIVDGQADQLGAGLDQLPHLPDSGGNVGGVGVCHGLHHDRGAAADDNAVNGNGHAAGPNQRLRRKRGRRRGLSAHGTASRPDGDRADASC